MENSLDAGATGINIQVKEGGLKLLQIQDNDCGIDKEDLSIVCERFTTSKLKDFDDLRTISTFGFRGEALASISHVSRLTITTKTAKSQCAFRASYSDAKLTADGIKPCAAASNGTQIVVEDLFYNTHIRRNALRSSSEEFSKIFETVARYAIHNYHISFVLKRSNENGLDLKTPGLAAHVNDRKRCVENEKQLVDNIAIVYGSDIKNELERIALPVDENFGFEMNGYMSNTKYSQIKQMIFILFINERLVDCQPLKKTLQTLFGVYMAKNAHPFVYVNLKMNPLNLDVNIHPSKHEVRFLYQDEIIGKINECVEKAILESDVSRAYYVKNLTIETFLPSSNSTLSDSMDELPKLKAKDDVVYPYQMTRVDSRERKLDSFLHKTTLDSSRSSIKLDAKSGIDDEMVSPLRRQKLDRKFQFKSLAEMRDKIEASVSLKARKILTDMSLVGCIDHELTLIQHQTGLYMVNTRMLSQELFYQICVFNFGNFGYFRFKEPISVFDLALIALDNPECGWEPDDGDKEVLASKIEDDEAYIEAVPMLLEDFEPDIVDLPMFILRMATEVNYGKERACFESVCYELSLFFSLKCNDAHDAERDRDEMGKKTSKPTKNWLVEHVIYPSFRNYLMPSVKSEELFFKLVDLHDLYKVFERC